VKIKLTREPFQHRPFTERRRLAEPRLNHCENTYALTAAPGVPPELQPIHRNLWTSSFPYRRAVDYPGHFEVRELPVVRLEDECARVTLLPSMGGRVLEYFDRKLNRQLLWAPPSLRLANLSASGPWAIGGIEFNAFRFSHNVHGISTVETRRIMLEDGRQAVAVGAFDELFGCSWEVMLTLVEGTLVTRMTVTNHSGKDQPCLYWWTCIAVPVQWRDRVMLAPGPFLNHGMTRQGYELEQWPIVHGVEWSQWLHQHETTSGYLANTRSDFMGYRNEKEGWSFVHRADRAVCRGRKLWSLGSQGVHHVWWQTLAEPNWTPYAELQCGLLPVQPDVGIFGAGKTIAWTEVFAAMPGASAGTTYAENFAAFEQGGLRKTGADWAEWNDPGFWRVKESEVLVPADARLDISRKLILTGSLRDVEISEAVETGWVGGESWIRLLTSKQAQLVPAARLALAAALINQNDFVAARRQLEPLADAGGEIGAYANYFLGLMAAEAGDRQETLARLRRSVGEGNADTNLLTSADKALSGFGLHAERKLLWQAASTETKATDDYRLAMASLALLDGNWTAVRAQLAVPLRSLAEGVFTVWLLYKESFFGEFAERCRAGDPRAALDALARGSEVAPQFERGRMEDRFNVDFLFYRYALCRQQGWDYMAAAFANMILLDPEHPGSTEALYALRVAQAENDPTAVARRQRIQDRPRDDADLKRSHPLRWALRRQVLDGSMDGWRDLEQHPFYRYRARFELDCDSAGPARTGVEQNWRKS